MGDLSLFKYYMHQSSILNSAVVGMRFVLIALFLISNSVIFAQLSPKELKQQADIFFENQKYQHALNSYQEYLKSKDKDEQALLHTAICLFHTNEIDAAQNFISYLIAEDKKNIPPRAYLYQAKIFHTQLDFQKATKYYKLFLANAKELVPERKSVRDAIRRCGNGLKLSYLDRPALVENLGDKVNSIYNDFAPVISPNYSNKLYFSSARSASIGGLRNAEGLRDNTYGKYSSDMYFTTINNGEWTATTPMSALLNTPRNDVILDFNADGSVLFFYKGYNLYSGEIFLDTFNTEKERLYPTPFRSALIPENGDGRPDFFKDSIVVFDSRRAGGYGGSDLYYTIHQSDGTWSVAKNMGKAINSAYDETTPFVAADGRTLFFSSNDSRKSIGGMDIFQSVFDYEKGEWSKPMNLGIPINSAGDDLFFSLSKDGLQGYFSSNRAESLGDNDIFVAYFKAQQMAQTPASEAPFAFVEYKKIEENATASGADTDVPVAKTYEIEALYYTNDSDVLHATNINRLNNVIALMQENPSTQLMLSCHSDSSDPAEFDLYFAIKRAEQAADYLVQNGIETYRISVRGVGGTYPIAQNQLNNQPNQMGQQLNRRIDIDVLLDDAVSIKKVLPNVSAFMEAPTGTLYTHYNTGLSYKIQVAALKQMYKGQLLKTNEAPLIERPFSSDLYQYTVGWFKQYADAKTLLTKLNLQGNTDVFIVPYVDGRRISAAEAIDYKAVYPDLSNFIDE